MVQWAEKLCQQVCSAVGFEANKAETSEHGESTSELQVKLGRTHPELVSDLGALLMQERFLTSTGDSSITSYSHSCNRKQV